MFYKDWGAGKPVVFVGTSLTSDAWQYQMTPMVGAGLRCIAYDRRGHGRSSQPGRGYDYDTLAYVQLKVYEGAPHGFIFTHIDRLNGDLLAFIKG